MHKNLLASKFLLSRLRLNQIISTVDGCFRAGQFWVYSAFQIITISEVLTLATRNTVQTTDVPKPIDTIDND